MPSQQEAMTGSGAAPGETSRGIFVWPAGFRSLNREWRRASPDSGIRRKRRPRGEPVARADLRRPDRDNAVRILLARTRYGETGEGDGKRLTDREGILAAPVSYRAAFLHGAGLSPPARVRAASLAAMLSRVPSHPVLAWSSDPGRRITRGRAVSRGLNGLSSHPRKQQRIRECSAPGSARS